MLIILILLCSVMLGCKKVQTIENSNALVIYSPHPLEFIDPIVSEFENDTGIAVEVVVAGTGELLTRIKTDTNSNCDVLWGGSLSTLENEKYLFEIYRSVNEEHAIYKNMDGHITRFTMVPSVIMINTNLIGDIEIEGFKDLLNPQLKGKIAYADPSKSSSSFEHLLNQLSSMGQGDVEKGWNYVERLIFNLDNTLLDGSSSVYNGVVQGQFTVGLTFEDPVAKFIDNGAPVKIVYPKEGTIFRPDGVSIIKDANNMEAAKQFVDFVTSKEVQSFLAAELNRRPIRNDVMPGKGLVPFSELIIEIDDQNWASSHKEEIISKYKKLFETINE